MATTIPNISDMRLVAIRANYDPKMTVEEFRKLKGAPTGKAKTKTVAKDVKPNG